MSSPQTSSSDELTKIAEIKANNHETSVELLENQIGEVYSNDTEMKSTEEKTEILITKNETTEEIQVSEESEIEKSLNKPVPSSVSLEAISMDRQESMIEEKLKMDTPHIVHINDPSKNHPSNLKNFFFPKFPSNYITTTKYRWYTFLIWNTIEQLLRISNIYFILVMIFALIPGVSPISPLTSIIPVVFIFGLTYLKDGFEDVLRYLSDRTVNYKKVLVVRNREEIKTNACNIRVGDIVKLNCDDLVPADFLLLSSSNSVGTCLVSTANLNGECNLKPCYSKEQTREYKSSEMISTLKGVVECEKPRFELEKFYGYLDIEGEEKVDVTIKNLLLRGCVIKNTKFIYALCIYTGKHSKLSLNTKKPRYKFSLLEKKMNWLLAFILFIHTTIVTLSVAAYLITLATNLSKAFYLKGLEATNIKFDFDFVIFIVSSFLAFFILNNLLIPGSLFVSLEIIKAIQARFMSWDAGMFYEDQKMKPITSNLNQDLSQIEWIFSDKTGTLTENIMNFQKCSVGSGDKIYDEKDGVGCLKDIFSKNNEKDKESAKHLLYNLVLNNTIEPRIDIKTNELIYDGSSIDELALIKAASNNGFKLLEKSLEFVEIEVLGKKETFTLLALLEFNSDRKRMSIIVKNSEDRIFCYTKGADDCVSKLVREDDPYLEKTQKNIDTFAHEGLRTLLICSKEITQEQFTTIDKDELIEQAEREMEFGLTIDGATAIEDCLQEEVPETIEFFREAGLQLWVLTGDKVNTAISIGKSSKLITQDTHLYQIVGEISESVESTLDEAIQKISEKDGKDISIVLDTDSIKLILEDSFLKRKLIKVIPKIKTAICCRVTPLQKAQIVALVQKKFKKVGLAIGDGANDVPMIDEANIGVGIIGKEGSIAARSSDFAIHRFKHLKRLLFVQGRYSYIRNGLFIQYSFYKNTVITFLGVFFNFFCAFTSTSVMNSWYITFYNSWFNALVPIYFGVFEKDYPEKVLEDCPELYKPLKKGYGFNIFTFIVWMVQGVLHASIIFFFAYGIIISDLLIEHRHQDDLHLLSFFLSFSTQTILFVKGLLHQRNHDIISFGLLAFSIVSYVGFFLFYSAFPIFVIDFVDPLADYFFVTYLCFYSLRFWVYVLLTVGTTLMFDVAWKYATEYFIADEMTQIYERYKKRKMIFN
eukprot:gene11071-3777_t